MVQCVILIGDKEFSLNTIRAMTFEGAIAVKDYGEKQIDVLFKEGTYASFQSDCYGTIRSDYSPEELTSLPYQEPQFILFRYSEKSLLQKVVSSKNFPADVFIDCDGLCLGPEQFFDKKRLLNSK